MDRPIDTPQVVRKAGILGIGLDDSGGHAYITRGDDFVFVGGTAETHALMRAKVEQFHQELAIRGKTILDLTEAELAEVVRQLG